MSMWRRYHRSIQSDFSLRGLYPPGKVTRLGDYGSYEDGSWKHQGNVQDDFGIQLDPRLSPPGSSWSVQRNVDLKAAVAVEGTGIGEVTASFGGMRSLFVLAHTPCTESLANTAVVATALAAFAEAHPNRWNKDWVFITAQVTSDAVTCIAAQGNDVKVVFKPSAGVLAALVAALAKADVSISVIGSADVQIIQQPGTLGIEIARLAEGHATFRSRLTHAAHGPALEIFSNIDAEPIDDGDDSDAG